MPNCSFPYVIDYYGRRRCTLTCRPDKLVQEGKVDVPMLFLWGDADPFTPMDGPIGRFFRSLPETRDDVTFTVIPDCGHCPHDDRPDLIHAEMLPWMSSLHGAPAVREAS